jgi:hypothetical protein
MKHRRSYGLFAGAAVALCLVTGLSGAAFAGPAAGVKGDPQPEARSFVISHSNSSAYATIAFEPNGSLVAAYNIPGGKTGKISVCELNRGRRACSHKVSLGTPNSGLGFGGDPQLLVTSANHVAVLEDTCCDNNTHGDTLLYRSTNGGKSFGSPVRIGSVVTGGAVLIGNEIVFIGSDFPDGIQVESIPVSAAGGPASVASLSPVRGDVGIGTYHGGVLAGWDFDGKVESTHVDYAPANSDFNSSGSYRKVLTIYGQQLVGMSGNALLTVQAGGKDTYELRLFNGKSFGPEHAVPHSAGGGPEWFGMQQDSGGVTHVFSEQGSRGPYDLYVLSTKSGTHWSSYNAGDATNSYFFAAGLDSHGHGIVLGPGGGLVTAYPILESQSVSFKLKSSSIRKGKSTTGSGKASPAATGRVVTLQVQGNSGKWFVVATTHEKSGGSFSFTIKGTSVGRFSYRAVASDLAGYLEYGYSNAKSLRVTG